MTKHDFLFELGCEELPAMILPKLSNALGELVAQGLTDANLSFAKPQLFATPRRLAIFVPELESEQASKTVERQGPSASAAFDKDGTPTLACLGFAKSCGVSADKLEVRDTAKGKRVFCKVKNPGEKTLNLLPSLMESVLKKLPIPKPMRWGDRSIAFIRPVHWLVMIYGDETVNATLFGIKAGRETVGHRFHHPEKIAISTPNRYESTLTEQGFVIPNFTARQEMIRTQLHEAMEEGLQAIIDESLLREVTGLVEWPVTLTGQFNPEFLRVPKEVLITSMKSHQKCFPVENSQNELQNKFILVSNINSKDPKVVIKGNERVIHARLSDAAFFYTNDLKISLNDRFEKLEHIVFEYTLGSMADKSRRIAKLAASIAEQTNADMTSAQRAGTLCKCDLVSEMVQEFPSLQGNMGYYYALNDNESASCANAILMHYKPRFAGDQLPESQVGCAVALSDRLDTLVGILGINKTPTGDKDPYALRRAAQGIFRILIENELNLDLVELLTTAKNNYQITLPNDNVVPQAFAFIMERLKYWYLEKGISPEAFEAVLASNTTSPLDFDHRLQAVLAFQQLPEAQALAAANKRVSNILKKTTITIPEQTNAQLFVQDEERELSKLLNECAKTTNTHYLNSDYTQALTQLSSLKDPVDKFFDQVMVMDEDEQKRNNRLALLAALRQLFSQVADISKL